MALFYGWIPPRSKKQPKRTQAFRPLKPTTVAPVNPRMEEYEAMKKACPSVGNGIGVATVSKRSPKYEDPDLAKREAEALQVKHTVAPICNKGGYQVITNAEDIKTAGRKV